MLTGFHFQDDSYPGPAIGAATFLDVAGAGSAEHAAQRLCRLFHRGRPDVGETRRRVAYWRAKGCRVVVHNEVNLAEEWPGCSPLELATWFLDVGAGYFPGLSPSGDWTRYLAVAEAAGALGVADGLVAHCYGLTLEQLVDSLRPVLEAARRVRKPVWVAEVNFGAGNRAPDLDAWIRDAFAPFLAFCARQPEVEAVTWFSWRWDRSATLPTSVDAAGTAIERLMRDWTPPPEETPPMPATPSRDELVAYARRAAMRVAYPAELFVRQIDQESGFDPHAVDRKSVV